MPKIWLGAENIVRRKLLSAENLSAELPFFFTKIGQKCRFLGLVPNILSAEKFCPPKILSAEFLSDKVNPETMAIKATDGSDIWPIKLVKS